MTDQVDSMQAHAGLSNWSDIWTVAITRPSIQTFEKLDSLPGRKMRRGVTWVLAGTAAATLIWSAFSWLNAGEPLGSSVAALLVVPILAAAWLLITAGSAHLIARLLGGTGQFDQVVSSFAASGAPLMVFTILVFLAPGMFRFLLLVFAGYGLFLNSLALQAVHRLSPGRSVTAVAPVALIVLIIPIAAVLIILGNLVR